MSIGVLDTNVMIYLFEELFNANISDFQRAILHLQTQFTSMWIPIEVRREFANQPSTRRRLSRVMKKYEDIIIECPVTTSKGERDAIVNGIDIGEADAIVQIQRAQSLNRFRFHSFTFISHDKRALQFAEDSGLSTLRYDDLREDLREIGIVM